MSKKSTRETNDLRRDETVPKHPQRDRSPDDFPDVESRSADMPPEGPHAKESLIDRDKTPGAGALTERRSDGDADAGTG